MNNDGSQMMALSGSAPCKKVCGEAMHAFWPLGSDCQGKKKGEARQPVSAKCKAQNSLVFSVVSR